ncbi:MULTISPECIES: sensor histidine kinase [unclassified Pseudomonas]|uniref:sensor histidine kinase n=1 Tax=unclassified Pseudomonas TaxID=196821 RepID=UPI00119C5BD1|nr:MULTISPECIES: sensor histidine kinase [unclassified Pseudomonas]TWC17568.1 phospho-acceptor domain-containing protein [Pseudomonas sp. SJZ074]TWC19696.1 phospho-acceptor domain-containing protein [Pseudomonas sp. SJZ075]TWC35404.1 phospho-acceptor domain-containing protein [Pseudomonas sp. SJZ078]TWC35522.1 phospho-acceptor domain-containing protein [Pseudomonas sp. SJZ085]TWC56350.1 phospho-acceptor domain-containing protein [Pseudomonas sp. SJZ124]
MRKTQWALRLLLLLGLALGIAAIDTLTDLEIAVGVFQIGVVLIAVRMLPARAVAGVSFICMVLTILSYRLTRFGDSEAGQINVLISLAAIAGTTYLALRLSAAIETVHRTRAHLAHIARVNMLGELAASIAHEVNQPLAAVANSSGACLRWMATEPPNLPKARLAVERIIADTHRASEIITRLRGMARHQTPTKQWLNVADTVNTALRLLAGELNEQGITLRVHIQEGLPPMLADEVQIQQVILNLAMNGIDAMRQVEADDRILAFHAELESGQQLLFSVSDQGKGLSGNDHERAFDAFYSTKPDGMGMGLAISRSIIEAHDGRIWVSSNPQSGATFHFTLPAVTRESDD